MTRNLLSRYIWLIDTLRQRGRLTRRQLNELWKQSALNNNGQPMCRRTLYNYKLAISELFGIDIECDTATFEYHIVDSDNKNTKLTDWLLNSSAVNEALSNSRDISDRIMLEDVPSAREHLPVILKSLKTNNRIKFDYHNYTRSRPTAGIIFEPYLTRIFKQRWYVIGLNVRENKLKTYALDRMSKVNDTGVSFKMPEYFNPETYFEDSFGIVVNSSEPREIVLRTDHFNAKYLAALPLHSSQQQTVHDHYCLFRYKMQITEDLIQELLGQGSRIVVEKPHELRLRIMEELRKSIAAYEEIPSFSVTTSSRSVLPITDPKVLEN